ncbi:hypothetical protein C4J81_17230 [Deltaproteobacteria bacterium Smac51]|nr:hypothetical protein C4J81_17230 [Deltaproteobacteria bacterium Smac51]
MAFQYKAPDEILSTFNALVIGGPGSGKTSLMATVPDGDTVCCLSAEGGLLSVKDYVLAGIVHEYPIGSVGDLWEGLNALKTEPFRDRYQWVFLDSLTEMAAICKKELEDKGAGQPLDFKGWGTYDRTMAALVRSFRDLTSHYNVIVICAESIEYDDLKCRFIAPAMPGKNLKELLPHIFDEVFHAEVEPDKSGQSVYQLRTRKCSGRPAKDRSGKLNEIETPNLAQIRAKILGEVK